MKISTAHQIVMDKIKELEDSGITVVREPTTSEIKEEKGGLPKSQWEHVCFQILRGGDLDKVFEADSDLLEEGISFDTGCGMDGRDWEIDWSFSCSAD